MSINDNTISKSKGDIVKSSGLLKTKGLLLVVTENFFGNSYILDKLQVTIGRDNSCDITINDPQISSSHCKIESDGEGLFFLTDLGSTNHTYINRKKIKKKKELLYGDRIVLGNTILRFFLEEKI
jgi:pSer/pThr/pTyr-binding forkhead associated (FHA) protein